MKKFIKTLGLSLMPWFCFGQLSGTVTDANTKEKLTGAVVTIENSFLVAVTNAEGKFSFAKLNEHLERITVTHLGYETLSKEISLPDEHAEISLQPKSYLTEEVVVASTRASDKSPTAFTNVSGEEIQKQNLGKDVPYLLNTTPSVVVTSDAGAGIGYTGIRVRGSDATRVNVTINGIPVNDAESHQVYWVDIPDIASSVDNIQIQRGIGTSTNGAGAFGASVNIQTTTLSAEPFGAYSGSYGSFNTWKNTASFGTGLMKSNFAFEGRLSKITSDGYIDRATSDLKSFYLSGGYYGSKSTLRAVIFGGQEKTYQSWYGVPEEKLGGNKDSLLNFYNNNSYYLSSQDSMNLFNSNNRTYNYYTYKNQTDNYQQDYYQLFYSYAASSKLNLNAALHYTKGKGYYEEYKNQNDPYGQGSLSLYHLDPAVINNDTISTTNLIRQLWLDNDFYGFTYAANYQSNKLELTFGGAGNRYEGFHYNQVLWMELLSPLAYPYVYDQDNAIKNDFNSFLKAIYSISPSLHLYGDLQLRNVNYSFRGFAPDMTQLQQKVKFHFFNPKAGLAYDFNSKNTVYASVGQGHKEPMRDDFINVSPQLPKPEQMTDLEAGYKYSGNKIRASVNFYYMNYKDQLVVNGKLNSVGAFIRQNVDKSYRRGTELELAWNATRKLVLSANLTLSQNKIETFSEYLVDYATYDNVINVHANTDISFSPSVISAATIRWLPIKNLSVDLISKYVGKQYLDNTSSEIRKIDPYFIQDIMLNYTIHTSFLKTLELKLAVFNLLNKKYESNGATYPYYYGSTLYNSNYYYPQAGTNWLGGVSVRF